MSKSSFLGLAVRIHLLSGEAVQGTITDIDTATGSLHLGDRLIARTDIGDIHVGATAPRSEAVPLQSVSLQAQSSFADPAIVSLNRPPVSDSELMPAAPLLASLASSGSSLSSPASSAASANRLRNAHKASVLTQASAATERCIPSSAPSDYPSSELQDAREESAGSSRGGSGSASYIDHQDIIAHQRKSGKLKASGDNSGGSPHHDHRLAINEQKNGRRGKREAGVRGTLGAQSINQKNDTFHSGSGASGDHYESDLEEDFDFGAALGKFDKGKVWEEIRNMDQTDPQTLLVSHNRKDGTKVMRTRGAQDKLLPTESVLSPSPSSSLTTTSAIVPNADSDLPDVAAIQPSKRDGTSSEPSREMVTHDQRAIREKMEGDKDDGDDTAARRGADSSTLLLQEKIELLETLLGIELQLDGSEGKGSTRWRATMYETATLQKLARSNMKDRALSPMMDQGKQGALCFRLGLLNEAKAKRGERLRYLGTIDSLSDAAIIARLPAHYRGELGLRKENAAIFFKRLREYCSPSTPTAPSALSK